MLAALLACLGITGCPEDSEVTSDVAITDAPQIDPLMPQVNQAVLLTAVVRNRDGNYTPRSEVAVRVDGVEVARQHIDAISPRESQSFTMSLRFSTAGTHSVALIIDPDERLNDTDRSNNTHIFTVTVTLPVSG